MPRVAPTYTPTQWCHVTFPGILTEVITLRREEFRYTSFAPFALELICFDLRRRRHHYVTLPFATEERSVQDALDRELVRRYEPGSEQRGLLVQAIACEIANEARRIPRTAYTCSRDRVYFPELLAEIIDIRWKEIGYPSFSSYLTGLIRYDLLLLGPHKYFNGDDTDPEILAAFDRETLQLFHENQPQEMYLERLIDSQAGRRQTSEERDAAMRKLAQDLRDWLTKPRKQG